MTRTRSALKAMPDFAHPTGESDREIKAQSAMEYLMTYSWTILIIAVVLGALFGLGVFNSGGFVGTSCTAASGYACQSPTLTTGGTLTFIAGENVGYIIYNVELECAASTAGGVPNPNAFNGIGATGAVLANVPDTTTGNSLKQSRRFVQPIDSRVAQPFSFHQPGENFGQD